MEAITLEEFRARFPQFDEISDTKIALAVEDAECETSESAFGSNWKRAVAHLAAHFIATTYDANGFEAAPNAMGGRLTGRTVKSVSETYATDPTLIGSDLQYSTTRHGQDFLRVRNQCIVGFGVFGARG